MAPAEAAQRGQGVVQGHTAHECRARTGPGFFSTRHRTACESKLNPVSGLQLIASKSRGHFALPMLCPPIPSPAVAAKAKLLGTFVPANLIYKGLFFLKIVVC